MYFEEQLGITPSQWLRCKPLDDFLAYNHLVHQPWEVQAADAVGMHISLLRMIMAFVASVFVGFIHRFVPTATGRHLYSFVMGALLLYFPFGNEVVLLLVLCALVYALLLVAPKKAGAASWAITFPFMLLCMERSGDLWDTGAVDATGALMVLLLKLVALSYNRADGERKAAREQIGSENQGKMIRSAPNPLHFLSYCFACGNLLAGPFFEYNDYITFTAREGEFAAAFRDGMLSPALLAVAKNFAMAVATATLHLFIVAKFPASKIQGASVWMMPLIDRLFYATVTGFGKRCQYYFVWALSEGSLNASGFGFNGYYDQEKKEPRFDKFLNTDIVKVETCTSLAVVPRFWNTNTGVFLRRYVYERVGGGFAGLVVTQLVSSVWHGLREGFIAFFFMSVFMFQASKVVYKQEARLPQALVKNPVWTALKWINSQMQLNIFCQPFLSLKWSLWIETWKAMYFIPHVIAIGTCAVGALIPTPRKRKGTESKNDPAAVSSAKED